jgi:trans-2,3-dihydro-3-hydroxyanthranilate isomerase
MASRVPFYFVDVFANRPLTGNPLSLVPDADRLDVGQIGAIAREFNQSETTFVLRPSLPGAAVRLRSFTPIGAEVGGAGHNALGAWLWMEAAGRLPAGEGDAGLRQEIGGEVPPVEVARRADEPATVWMDQSAPRFGALVTDRTGLAAALGLAQDDLAADRLLPVQHRTGGPGGRGRVHQVL